MKNKCYLAMTAAEFQNCPQPPEHTGWMACHFSPYGTGLSNLPQTLPEGGMLILNDRTPISGHDHLLITNQLVERIQTLPCSCVLLDFEREGVDETAALVRQLSGALPCPVGVSASYAHESGGPVFLPPVPPETPIEVYLAPWKGRELWLEAALNSSLIILTETGALVSSLSAEGCPDCIHQDPALHCHYGISLSQDAIRFTLYRTQDDLRSLLKAAQALGVTQAVGLWQELRDFHAE